MKLSQDKNMSDMNGFVGIDPAGKPTAEQMWNAAKDTMEYTKNLAEEILETLGVTKEDKLPLSCTLLSLTELRNKFIAYQTRTFVYNGTHGTGMAGDADDICNGTSDATPEEIMLERVKSFAESIPRADRERMTKDDEMSSKRDEACNKEELPEKRPTTSHHTKLM